MRIRIDKLEIILHRFANIFADHLGILPSPFRVEVGIPDHIEGRLFAQIRFIGAL